MVLDLQSTYQGSTSGGGGLLLRQPPNIFTGATVSACRTARNTYFNNSANAAVLRQYQDNENLAIVLDPTGADNNIFETYTPGESGSAYDATKWLSRTDAVQGNRGAKGDKGDTGAAGKTFDLYPDVGTEVTALADDDRMVVADASESGEPNRYATMTTLKDYTGSGGGGGINLTDAQIGDKAFSNPPADLTTTEKTAVRSAIGAGTGSGGGSGTGGIAFTVQNYTVSATLTSTAFGKILVQNVLSTEPTLTLPSIRAEDVGKFIAFTPPAGSGENLTLARTGIQSIDGQLSNVVVWENSWMILLATSTTSWVTIRPTTRLPTVPSTQSTTRKYELQVTSGGAVSWVQASTSGGGTSLTDAQIGDKAFSNPPSDLTSAEEKAVRDAIDFRDGIEAEFTEHDDTRAAVFLGGSAFFPATDKRNRLTFYTGSSAPSGSSTATPYPPSNGAHVIAFGTTLLDQNAPTTSNSTKLTAADFPSGTTLHLFDEQHAHDGRVEFVTSANATLVGSGNGEYLWAPGTVTRVGSPVAVESWLIVSHIEPPDLRISYGLLRGAPTDAQIGDRAFSNPPTDLTNTEKTAVRTAIGAGTGGGTSLTDAQIGDKAFSNPPSDLTSTEKTAVRTAIDVEQGIEDAFTPHADTRAAAFIGGAAFYPKADKRGDLTFYTGNDAPSGGSTATTYPPSNGAHVIAFGTTLLDASNPGGYSAVALTAGDLPSGSTLRLYDEHRGPTHRVDFVTTANATLVGTGNGAYLWAPGTVTRVGTPTTISSWLIVGFGTVLDVSIPAAAVEGISQGIPNAPAPSSSPARYFLKGPQAPSRIGTWESESDAQVGDRAFSNPPSDLTAAERQTVRTRIGLDTTDSKNADYTIVAADRGKTIRLTGTTARTFTLPNITGSVGVGWDVWIANDSAANLTIDGDSFDTINGVTTYTLAPQQAVLLQVSANINWQVRATSNVGDITGVTAGTNLTGGGTNGAITINAPTDAQFGTKAFTNPPASLSESAQFAVRKRIGLDSNDFKISNYTLVASDQGKTIQYYGTAAATFTLPNVTGDVTIGWWVRIVNDTDVAGFNQNLTIDADSTDTIEGNATIVLAPGAGVLLQVVQPTYWSIRSFSSVKAGTNLTASGVGDVTLNAPSDAAIGDKAFKNPPTLTDTEEKAVRDAVGFVDGVEGVFDIPANSRSYEFQAATDWFSATDRRSVMSFSSDTTAPDGTGGLTWPPRNGSGTVMMGTTGLVFDRPYSGGVQDYHSTPLIAGDIPNGTKLYLYDRNVGRDKRVEFTTSAAAVVVSTGNAQYIWAPGSFLQVGTVPSGVSSWLNLNFELPADVKIPYAAVEGIPQNIPDTPDNSTTAKKYELSVPANSGLPSWDEATVGSTSLTAAQIGDRAFSNPPSDLTDTEKTAARDAIGAGTGGGVTLTDAQIGDKAFSNPPNDLTETEKESVLTSVGLDTTEAKTVDYTIIAADRNKTIRLTGATARTFTLPDITGDVSVGWSIWLANDSSAALTIDGNGSDTIDGNATATVDSGATIRVQVTGTTTWAVRAISKAPVPFTDAQIGAKAFANPPSTLTTAQKQSARTAIGLDVTETKTANYTITADDRNKVIQYDGGANATFTLPDITGTVAVGWSVFIANETAYTLTLDGNGSDTIEDESTLALAPLAAIEVMVVSTTKWRLRTSRGIPPKVTRLWGDDSWSQTTATSSTVTIDFNYKSGTSGPRHALSEHDIIIFYADNGGAAEKWPVWELPENFASTSDPDVLVAMPRAGGNGWLAIRYVNDTSVEIAGQTTGYAVGLRRIMGISFR